MKQPKGVTFKEATNQSCETCLQAVLLDSDLDLSEDSQNPSTVHAFVRKKEGRNELVLRQAAGHAAGR